MFFPGFIIDIIPRDEIYLEWTNAFFHSPPEGSSEALDNGLAAPLYIADKFVSQFMALNLLILCMYKLVSCIMIRIGSDGSGEIKAKIIWKIQAIGNALLLFVLRIFTPAASTASLDLRWHLVLFAFETLILGRCNLIVNGLLVYYSILYNYPLHNSLQFLLLLLSQVFTESSKGS